MAWLSIFISVPSTIINLLQTTCGISQNKEAAFLMFTGNNIPEHTFNSLIWLLICPVSLIPISTKR